MPKPVTKYEAVEMDWSAPDEEPSDICNTEFHSSKKLGEMSEQEKEQLYRQYLMHSKTVNKDVAELTPTQVIDGPRKKVKPKPAPVTDKGIVVPGEDFDVLSGLVGKEEARKMMSVQKAREVGEAEADRKEMASKTAAERNALTRFDRI